MQKGKNSSRVQSREEGLKSGHSKMDGDEKKEKATGYAAGREELKHRGGKQ